MRLFIAIDLPKEIKDELYNIQKNLNKGFAKIKWVSKKNLHLTLKFLGETEVDIDEIDEKLQKIKFDKFNLELDKFGFFSNNDKVNVLWVGVKPKENLINLQQEVDSELFGLFKKDQRFTPHLTLGRVKFVKKEKEFFDCLENVSVKPLKFEVKGFGLFESKLTKDGSQYRLIKEYLCR